MGRSYHFGVVSLLLSVAFGLANMSCVEEKMSASSALKEPEMEIVREPLKAELPARSFEVKVPNFVTYEEAAKESSVYYLSSRTCRRCHKDIYESWNNSMHRMAMTDPIFQASFLKAYRGLGEGAEQYCLRCHAPLAFRMEPVDLENEAVQEGVTCDFCHSIKAVNLDAEDKYELTVGGLKIGPNADINSPFHESEKGEHFRKSELCGGCHNMVNENGVEVMGTYSEWKDSKYPSNGVHCQNCHMPIDPNGRAVEGKFSQSNMEMNAHYLQGGHSAEQLRKAVKVEIMSVQRLPETAIVIVNVRNIGAGHKIPTGTPSRYLSLEVAAYSDGGKEIARKSIQYKKVLTDQNGNVLRDDADLILLSANILTDNRLEPGETRTETFRFDIARRVKMEIKAELVYSYDPVIFVSQAMRLRMAQDASESD